MKAFELRAERAEEGVTQEEMSKEMSITVGTLIDIERGRIGIDQATYDDFRAGVKRVAARKNTQREGVMA